MRDLTHLNSGFNGRQAASLVLLFTAIALVAHVAGATGPKVAMGATIFFWSRVLYVPIYYAGIAYLRTAVWFVGMIGLMMMIAGIL